MKSNKTCTTTSLLLTGLMIVGVAGCSTAPKDQRSAGRLQDDRHLTESIRKNLDSDPVYKFYGVHVNTYAGQVQLSGFVDTDAQKKRAAEIAQQTAGVNTVLDELALKPMAPTPTGRTGDNPRIYAPPTGSDTNQPAPPDQNR